MKIDLTVGEAQALLDGINVVIKEKAKDVDFFRAVQGGDEGKLDVVVSELRKELETAKSAQRKIQSVK